MMPLLEIGDWLYYDGVGAYNAVIGSNFNGFSTAETYAFISEKNWQKCK